jgi:hypothetical protein
MRWDQEGRKSKEWNYLDIVDYQKIVKDNSFLKNYFLYDPSISGKNTSQLNVKNATKWIITFNDIRKKYSHITKELEISSEEYSYLSKIKNWFLSNICFTYYY